MSAGRVQVLLVHGWGFGPEIWDRVAAALPGFEIARVDLGFFGPPRLCPPSPQPVLAVGHSLGLLWLLQHRPCPWRALISINGFPRFTETEDYRPAVPVRLLERMLRRLDQDPAAVVGEFRHRCGCADPLPGRPETARLRWGLEGLRDWDARASLPEAGPRLALGGGADPILPAGMAADGFAREHETLAGAGHLLPLEAPDWCAARIARVAEAL
jgi:pimeloyl-[acyl-carrier protein] methyl ester esterase